MLAAPSAQLLEELECWENYKPRFANEENSQKYKGNQEGGGKGGQETRKNSSLWCYTAQERRRAPGLSDGMSNKKDKRDRVISISLSAVLSW